MRTTELKVFVLNKKCGGDNNDDKVGINQSKGGGG